MKTAADDDPRPYPCGAFVTGTEEHCQLDSDHDGPHLFPSEPWGVSVTRNGENIITIESRMLAGKADLDPADIATIRECARHLLAFAGEP